MVDPSASDLPPFDEDEATPRGATAFSPEELDGMSEEELLSLVEAALDRLSVEKLTAVMNTVEEQRRDRNEQTRQSLLEEFRDLAQRRGVSFDALFPSYGYGARIRRSGAGTPGPVMYRSPSGQTWVGKGRKPRWLEDLEKEGHDKEEFRVG